MQVATAKQIAKTWFKEDGQAQAIRLLHAETHLGTVDARRYLEEYSEKGVADLHKQLVNEFCNEPEFLLEQAEAERKRLEAYIVQLKTEIERNKHQELDDEDI